MSFEETEWGKSRFKQREKTYKSYKHPKHPKNGSLPKTNFKYKLHPDPSFDPSEYLLAEEIRSREVDSAFRKEIRKHRFGFFRLYGMYLPQRGFPEILAFVSSPIQRNNICLRTLVETIRKSSKVPDHLDDRFQFLQFLKNAVVEMQVSFTSFFEFFCSKRYADIDRPISYTFWMFLLHMYIIGDNLTRLTYCVNIPSTYTLLHSPQTLLFTFQCAVRPRTFVDFVSWLQLCFYGQTLLFHLVNARFLERMWYIHGPYLLGGALWSAFWFLPSRGGGSMNSSEPYSKNTLWMPLLQWALFAFSRRYYLGVMHWEYENGLRLDDEKDQQDAFHMFGTSLLFDNLRSFCFTCWIYTLPAMPILFWETCLKPRELTDLHAWPGLIWVIMTCLLSTAGFRVFLSMMYFQYQCVAWVEPWKSGLVFRKFDRELSFGIVS